MRNNLFLGVAVAALVVPAAASAQDVTSAIRGTVTVDGAPVVGATVTAENTGTGQSQTATTSDSGTFTFNGLRPGGPYTVSVQSSDGNTQVTDIFTDVAQTFDLPIALESTGGDIVVTASSIVNAGSISQGPATVLTAEKIATIASVNRDIRDLSRRDPFARLDDTPSGGRAISFAGQNARFNKFSVDGVAITDNFGLNPDGLPSRRSPIPFDAIGQFQAAVAPYDVRQGNFQGGAINIVLRSGTNSFQGTGFFAYSSDELTGKETKAGPGVPTGRVTLPNFEYKNYGVQLSGPIIEDKLFFMVAAERLRAPLPIAEGPVDNNAGTVIANLTQASVDQISAIAQSRYGYATGGVLNTNGDEDDRLVAKLDANFSDNQRASLTYTYAEDAINLIQNAFTTNPTGLGLASNAYIQGNRLHTGVFQLNSDWSDEFSTEVRAFYKNYVRIQDPLLGRGFAQFQVCNAPTSDRLVNGVPNTIASASITCANTNSTVSFGPDVSRQTNALNTESYGGTFQARLTRDDHDLRIFGEASYLTVFNSFLQRSAGDYYFDSIADFQAGNAQRFRYGNAIPSLNPDNAAASFNYMSYAFGIQDNWAIQDDFNLNYGVRYDLYGSDSRAALNNVFVSRYNFANNAFLSGRGAFQPRIGFDWKPVDRLRITGGWGIFAGGAPDVYFSNSFSNTGILTNTIEVQQANNGTISGSGASAAQGTSILTNVNGAAIPAAANTLIGNAAVAANAPTNAVDPNFKIPSQYRSTFSATYDADFGGFLGDNWQFGANFLFSRVKNQVYFTDLRLRQNGLRTPDGRIRYTNLVTPITDTNSDILLTNTTLGRSYVGVVSVRKNWDFGLEAGVSYAYQDIKDATPATSSTAGSNYAAGVSLQPNGAAYGISNDEVKHNIKYDINFDHAFFGDYKTNIALFGETRIGRPYSYTLRDTAARSILFGTIGSGVRYLMYVPTGVNDPLVSFDNANNAALFDDFVNRSGLGKYRGKIAPRNAFNSKWFTKIDLHVSQEIPTFVGDSRVTLFADIENFTNFLNKKWGQIREYPFAYTIAPVIAQCLSGPVATGTTPTAAQLAANSTQACNQYRYTPNQTAVVNGVTQFTDPTDTIYSRQSLYSIRIGARFSF